MSERLRVNPAAVTQAGEGLSSAAASVPSLPEFTSASGGDPLSKVAARHQHTAEASLHEGLLHVRANCVDTAGKTTRAAQMYSSADAELASRLAAITFPNQAQG